MKLLHLGCSLTFISFTLNLNKATPLENDYLIKIKAFDYD